MIGCMNLVRYGSRIFSITRIKQKSHNGIFCNKMMTQRTISILMILWDFVYWVTNQCEDNVCTWLGDREPCGLRVPGICGPSLKCAIPVNETSALCTNSSRIELCTHDLNCGPNALCIDSTCIQIQSIPQGQSLSRFQPDLCESNTQSNNSLNYIGPNVFAWKQRQNCYTWLKDLIDIWDKTVKLNRP